MMKRDRKEGRKRGVELEQQVGLFLFFLFLFLGGKNVT